MLPTEVLLLQQLHTYDELLMYGRLIQATLHKHAYFIHQQQISNITTVATSTTTESASDTEELVHSVSHTDTNVLSHVQQNEEHIITHAIKTLFKEQKNYSVTRKELLAMVFFLKYFQHHKCGRYVIFRTDHAALKWLFNFKEAGNPTF